MFRTLLSLALTFALCAPAYSATISFSFFGVGQGEPTTIAGTFGYESATPDSFPLSPDFGLYNNSAFIQGTFSNGTLDGYSFSLTGGDLGVTDGDGSVVSDFIIDLINIDGFGNSATFLNLIDAEANALPGISPPTTIDLSAFEQLDLFLDEETIGFSPFTEQHHFLLTSIVAAPVPAPILLLCSAVAALGLFKRKMPLRLQSRKNK